MTVGLLLGVLMSVTACGTGKEAMIDDPDLTKQAAIAQALEHLERTEVSLPDGMALSVNSDAPGAIDQEGSMSGSISCSGSDGAGHTDPHMVQMDYFVTGVSDGENSKYLMQTRRLWESWGWTPTEEPKEEWTAYENERGYILRVQHYGKPGTLSVGGQTPCIAGEKFKGSDEVPQQIGGEGS